ncbi:MAG TPA: hypothetical protein VH877_30775 [Polyangia bacterium]|nr:hypothetical protein [Polyangia bacterium]
MLCIPRSRGRRPRVVLGILPCLLCAALACSKKKEMPPPEPARPPGAGQGDTAARAYLRGGERSRIKAETGVEFPPLPGMPLLRTDQLVVPGGEFLLLRLGNGHLVRIDEDLTMKVSEIVLLEAPPAGESVAAQLDRLVTREELARAERMAGAQARRQAAESMPAMEEEPDRFAKVVVPAKDAPGSVSASAAPAPAGADKKAVPKAPAEKSAAAQEERRARLERDITSQGLLRLLGSRGGGEGALSGAGGLDIGAALAPEVPELPRLRECLARELGHLPVKLKKVTLRLRSEGGKVTRVVLGGALPTPVCARDILIGQTFAAEGPWRTLEIELPSVPPTP